MKSAIEVDLQNFVQNIIQQNCVPANEMIAIMKHVEEKISMSNSQDSEEAESFRNDEDVDKIIKNT